MPWLKQNEIEIQYPVMEKILSKFPNTDEEQWKEIVETLNNTHKSTLSQVKAT